MSAPRLLVAGISIIAAIASVREAHGQTLPGSMSFSVSGRFTNGVAESSNSLLVTDNNLTNGYNSEIDLHNAPATLANGGPAGSSVFQWGRASSGDTYPHASALWFEPLAVKNAEANQDFGIGYLYYRNGTIESSSGASAVDLTLTFTLPGQNTMVTSFTSNLINTPNTGTATQNADIVSLANRSAPLSYKDVSGTTYYLDLSFRVDADTLNNSLSNTTEFRAFEGTVSRAEIIGRFTTTPGVLAVPEASSLLLGALGSLFLLRRKR